MAELCLPKFLDGTFKIFIDKEFPVTEIKEAHEHMEADKNKGKIVITGFTELWMQVGIFNKAKIIKSLETIIL